MEKKNTKIRILLIAILFTGYLFGQVGIGTFNPDKSSILELQSADKGLLISRVDLTSSTLDLDGVPGQATGLLIYNIGSTLPTGFYYWSGTDWRNIRNSTSQPAVISEIQCNTALLSPSTYTSGVPYNGYMTVTYSGGNGADYSSQAPINSTGVTGLTATLSGGTLSNGSGTFTYVVSGTPSASSPNTASFLLPTTFGGTGCTATVGSGQTLSVGQIKSFRAIVSAASFTANGGSRNVMTGKNLANVTTTNRRSAWELSSPSEQAGFPIISGLRMDFLESGINNGAVSAKLFNTTGVPVTYNISSLSTNDAYLDGGSTTIAPNAYSYFIDGDDNMGTVNGGTIEYVNSMLTLASGEWYMITYHATRDATNYYFYMTVQRMN